MYCSRLSRSWSAADRRSGGELSARVSPCTEKLGSVYHNDALTRERDLSAVERLLFHQEHSAPVMKELHGWMTAQLEERRTEPNCGLGKAITYLLNHWTKLTLFVRQSGAPIDNNIVERS